MSPKYPDVEVQLVGQDGNAGAIMDRVVRALRAAKVPRETIDEYRRESMAGDYANLLRVAEEWVYVY